MQKLKAFTLMELLIGMIVSSIVISFCYMSYEMIYKQFINYKTVKQELVEAMQFHTVLNQDFVNAQKIMFQHNELILVNKNSNNINYNFDERFVLRKRGESTDTFLLKPTNLVADYAMVEDEFSKPVVLFSFDANVLEVIEHFQFSKIYDSEIIVNNEIQNLKKD